MAKMSKPSTEKKEKEIRKRSTTSNICLLANFSGNQINLVQNENNLLSLLQNGLFDSLAAACNRVARIEHFKQNVAFVNDTAKLTEKGPGKDKKETKK